MCHDTLEVIVNNSERIEFIPSPDYIGNKNYSHCVNRDKTWGVMRHVEYRHDEFTIWKTYHFLERDAALNIHWPGHSSLGLVFTLGEDIPFDVNDLKGISRNGHYNMVYHKEIRPTLHLERQKVYILLGINFSPEYLNAPGMPEKITSFIKRIAKGELKFLDENEFPIEHKMIKPIATLRELLREGRVTANFQLGELVFRLCRRSFKRMNIQRTTEQEEQTKFQAMTKYIDENLSAVSVNSLKKEFGYLVKESQTLKLRKFIHKHAKTTIKGYIADRKLIRALELVTNTTIPINRIAEMVGFKAIFGFTGAFKRRYNVAPKVYRNQFRKNDSTPDELQ